MARNSLMNMNVKMLSEGKNIHFKSYFCNTLAYVQGVAGKYSLVAANTRTQITRTRMMLDTFPIFALDIQTDENRVYKLPTE